MILMHQTVIRPKDFDWNIVEFDETFNDKVFKRIYWFLVTRDIDPQWFDQNPGSRLNRAFPELWYTDLPAPTAETFIPYEEVSTRDMLRWIRENENEQKLEQAEFQGLVGLCKKYDYELPEPYIVHKGIKTDPIIT